MENVVTEVKKEMQLFTDGLVEMNGRGYARLIGGFGDGKPMFTVWQAGELLNLGADVIKKDFTRNASNFQVDVDYKDLKSAKNLKEVNKFLKSIGYSQSKLNATKQWLVFNLSGILKLIEIADISNDYTGFLKEYFKVKYIPNLKLIRHEINFKDILYAMLSDYMTIKSQFPILQYKIDFFIPEMNLIIEYDEEQHKYFEDEDKIRENNIINEFLKWEEIFTDKNENVSANIKIIRVKKGLEADGIKQIMHCVAIHGSNLIVERKKHLYENIEDIYDYFNEIYDFTYFKDKIITIGYKIK